MAESAVMRLEVMLPEVMNFEERGIFTKDELKLIMAHRRKFEYAIASRTAKLEDFMSYIDHEIKVEVDRRERYANMNIKKETPRDFSVVQRIHYLFSRCISKYSSDVEVWKKYIDFCITSGSSTALTKATMRAIKRHPRVALFRVMAADRELQIGSLLGARKMLMLAVRAKTDDRSLIWEQLFKLECLALHRKATGAEVTTSANTAVVVVRHGLADLGLSSRRFSEFCREALETLEMSLLGFPEPEGMDALRTIVRQ